MFPPSHRSPHLPCAAGLAVLQVELRALATAPDPCRAGTDLASPCLEAGRGKRGGGGGEVGLFGCSAGLSQTYESDRTGIFNPVLVPLSFSLPIHFSLTLIKKNHISLDDLISHCWTFILLC